MHCGAIVKSSRRNHHGKQKLLTHAKTGVIQMGWPKLYEAVAFKGNKDDDKSAKKDDKKKNESTPAYGFPRASRQG